MKIVYLLFVVFVATCNAYPNGAPLLVCDKMLPAHTGIPVQTSTPPVTLTVSENSYTPTSTLTSKLIILDNL